jgi:nitrogen fixation protein NifB
MIDKDKHPCFSFKAKHEYGRIHLPVAPKCNVQCNYCSRKYDCVNESRPGVTSNILTPRQALEYTSRMIEKAPNISVVGIAGPGDAFANPDETLETMRLVHEAFPEILFCVSTNGLEAEPYLDELPKLGVSHVTVTINSLEADTLSDIYAWVRYQKKMYRGKEAGMAVKEAQRKVMEKLAGMDMLVKINTLLLPGINHKQIVGIAAQAKEWNAEMMNILPIKPVAGTPFGELPEPSEEDVKEALKKVSTYVQPMTHCSRCRADAAGIIGQDIEERHEIMKEVQMSAIAATEGKPYVAAATNEGLLVNMHLGEAEVLYIYEETEDGYEIVEKRDTPLPGAGEGRWKQLADIISDCRALLVGGCGPSPLALLNKKGINVVQMTGLVEQGLESVYKGTELRTIKKADMFKCGTECRGTATGCA